MVFFVWVYRSVTTLLDTLDGIREELRRIAEGIRTRGRDSIV
jgi:hypothetical protein